MIAFFIFVAMFIKFLLSLFLVDETRCSLAADLVVAIPRSTAYGSCRPYALFVLMRKPWLLVILGFFKFFGFDVDDTFCLVCLSSFYF